LYPQALLLRHMFYSLFFLISEVCRDGMSFISLLPITDNARTNIIQKKKSLLCNSEDMPVKDYELCDYEHHKP